jgi:beta-lactam-binding protein with PASTA domain
LKKENLQRVNNIWSFIFSRAFLYCVIGAIVFYILFLLVFAFFVRSYTKHGEVVTVPDLQGKSFDEARTLLAGNDLEYKITDSSFDDKMPPLTVIDQTPQANSKVKEYRTIYLTVNSKTAPEIKMPDLKDASLKQATMILQSYSMKVGKLIYKPDLAENVVLEQQMNGIPVKAGSSVKKGSVIDLVVGDGLGQQDVEIPNLVGLSLREARFVLEGSNLNLGAVVADATVSSDSLDAIVYQQVPDARDSSRKINVGEGIDVFITSSDLYENRKAE